MRVLLLLLFFCCFAGLSAQIPGNLGLDDNPVLNMQEATFLNSILKKKQDTTDLSGRKVAFVTGSSGKELVSKSLFFKNKTKAPADNAISIILLTDDEKRQSGGYDAIILAWVKVVFGKKQRQKIVSALHSGTAPY